MAVNLGDFRQRLLTIEERLADRLAREVNTAREVRDDQADAGDLAHVDELKDDYFALADTDSAILAQVRAALNRIDHGTYGRCIVDDKPIDPKRLESIPWTPYCLKHQLELEARAGIRSSSL